LIWDSGNCPLQTTEQSDPNVAKYEQAFAKYDPNGYCLVPLDLLHKMLDDLGIKPNKAIMALELPKLQNDTNLISISQFIYLCQQLADPNALKSRFQRFMQRFDTNDNNEISRDELREAMNYIGEKMTESQIDSLMKAFDIDGDGQISLDDFCSAMM